MSDQNALIIHDQVNRYNLMVNFVKTVMQKDRDFGTVPGTQKPTLLKPGAEKLNSLFSLYPKFSISEKAVDWDKGLFFYQYECTLVHRQTGEIWGTGLGSCNSRESKYRYRYAVTDKKPTKQEAAELKARGIGKWQKRDNGWVWTEKIENDQIFDIVNTIDKMAQKRALIAATLIACNASEFFTQDVEDIPGFAEEVTEAEYTEVPPPPEQPQNSTPAQMPEFDTDLPQMVYEEACLVRSSTGELYGDIDTGKLSYMYNSIMRSGSWREDEAKAIKASAIKSIIEWRNANPAA